MVTETQLKAVLAQIASDIKQKINIADIDKCISDYLKSQNDTAVDLKTAVIEIINNNLETIDLDKAVQEAVSKILRETIINNIVDNLVTDDETKSLSAKQGKVLNEKLEAQYKKQVMTTSGDVTISPFTFYVWNNDVATLNIAFDDANSDTFIQEFHFMFNSGSTATALTLPINVRKPSDFKIEANKIYEISILENCLSYQSWDK